MVYLFKLKLEICFVSLRRFNTYAGVFVNSVGPHQSDQYL